MFPFRNRRKSERQEVNFIGRIEHEDAPSPVPCVVSDISDGGARIVVNEELPDQLTLVLEGQEARHACRVVWRLDQEVGVEFLKAD